MNIQKDLNIQLNERYRIVSDAYNYILQEKAKPKGTDKDVSDRQESYKSIGWYGNIHILIKSLTEREMKQSGAISWEEVIKHVVHLENNIVECVEGKL